MRSLLATPVSLLRQSIAVSGSSRRKRDTSTIAPSSITANGSGFLSLTSRTLSGKRCLTRSYASSASTSGLNLWAGRLREPPLSHDFLLELEQSFGQGLGTRRTSGDVNIHRQDLVDAVANRIRELEQPAAIRTASHRDDVLRIGHLVVEQARPQRHFERQRACDDHQVGLACGGPRS